MPRSVATSCSVTGIWRFLARFTETRSRHPAIGLDPVGLQSIDDKVLYFQKSGIAVDIHRAIDPRRYLRSSVRVGSQRLTTEQTKLAVMVATALTATTFNANAQD